MLASLFLALQAASGTHAVEAPQQLQLSSVEPDRKQDDKSPATDGKSCTDNKSWCITLDKNSEPESDGPTITVEKSGQYAKAPSLHSEFLAFGSINLWDSPVEYRTASGMPGLVFGAVSYHSQGYSGGGAGSSSMLLYVAEIQSGGKLKVDLLDDPIPYEQSALIRACFSEEDMKLRRNVCHDEYDQDVSIKPTGAMRNGLPELLYISNATVSPGFARRDQDNSDDKLLKTLAAKDFETRVDDRCTYTRKMYVHEDRDRYVLDFKDCSDFGADVQ